MMVWNCRPEGGMGIYFHTGSLTKLQSKIALKIKKSLQTVEIMLVFFHVIFFFNKRKKHIKMLLKKTTHKHNHKTKIKSLRLNVITETSLIYWSSLWNFNPLNHKYYKDYLY